MHRTPEVQELIKNQEILIKAIRSILSEMFWMPQFNIQRVKDILEIMSEIKED